MLENIKSFSWNHEKKSNFSLVFSLIRCRRVKDINSPSSALYNLYPVLHSCEISWVFRMWIVQFQLAEVPSVYKFFLNYSKVNYNHTRVPQVYSLTTDQKWKRIRIVRIEQLLRVKSEQAAIDLHEKGRRDVWKDYCYILPHIRISAILSHFIFSSRSAAMQSLILQLFLDHHSVRYSMTRGFELSPDRFVDACTDKPLRLRQKRVFLFRSR